MARAACMMRLEAARALTEVRGADCVAFAQRYRARARLAERVINAIERAPDTVAATIDGDSAFAAMPASADARCTLVAPRLIPQHLRIEPAATFDAALAGGLAQSVDAGRAIARAGRTATRPGPAGVALPAAAPARPRADAALRVDRHAELERAGLHRGRGRVDSRCPHGRAVRDHHRRQRFECGDARAAAEHCRHRADRERGQYRLCVCLRSRFGRGPRGTPPRAGSTTT